MCQARYSNGAFDPALCPLLVGLSPEEIAERLANDPIIRSCAGMDDGENSQTLPDHKAMPCLVDASKLKATNTLHAFV